ncbi:MAG: metal-sensitive transcriptional regulator [Deltaproteobacteria bacterium]|nr:metal-sensitive transcriptional regulator [Deltaproteobacteria bacterium]
MKHVDTLGRLKKIEGQVRGVTRMVEDGKYCIDIINQIAAAKGALDKVSLIILKNHMESCVATAIRQKEGAGEKIDEVIASVEKYLK